jgi:hypothetical protein
MLFTQVPVTPTLGGLLARIVGAFATPATAQSGLPAAPSGFSLEGWQGLIGVIAGILLAEGFRWLREERRRKEERVAVRLLISLEIDDDLAALDVLASQLSEAEKVIRETDPELPRYGLACGFLDMPVPAWSRHMWDSQTAKITGALAPQEIKSIHALHSDFDAFLSIRASMAGAQQQAIQTMGGLRESGRRFDELDALRKHKSKVAALMAEVQIVIDQIKEIGNPIE